MSITLNGESPAPLSAHPLIRTASCALAATEQLAVQFRDRAEEGEQLRTMPTELVARVRAAGLFTLALPHTLGGLELDPLTIVSIIEQLSYADASAGWTTMIGNSTSFLAWLDPAVAADFVARGVPTMGSVFAPTGRAAPRQDGAFDVTGRWAFSSGSPHTEWFFDGVFVLDGSAPRMIDGKPDWRFGLFSAADTEIIDTWNALGLRGTGSHDVQLVHPTRVPEEHMVLPFDIPARHDGPLYRYSFWSLLTVLMAGIALGIGQRALDELATLAPHKRRPTNTAITIAEDPHVQIEFARAETALQCAKTMLVDSLGTSWDTACNGDIPSGTRTATTQMAMLEVARVATAATAFALRAGGAGAVYNHQPIQRCFRDMHTVIQHIAYSDNGLNNYSRTRFGLNQQ
jgi:alkylation response protein AidB-like acyl-CoA dehydrogenase